MKYTKRNVLVGGALIILLSVGFSTIRNKDLELVKNLDIFYTLFRELNMFYVDETDPENAEIYKMKPGNFMKLTVWGDENGSDIKLGDKRDKIK